MSLRDTNLEMTYLRAYVQGHVDELDPAWFEDVHKAVAVILAKNGRPEIQAEMDQWLAQHSLPISSLAYFEPLKVTEAQLRATQNVLLELAYRRRAAYSALTIQQAAARRDLPVKELVDLVEQGYAQALGVAMIEDDPTEEARSRLKKHLAGEDAQGWRMTWAPLMDKLVGPLRCALLVIAAMTSHGKSTWTLRYLLDWAQQGAKVMVSSPDMGSFRNWLRFLSLLTGIPLFRIKSHTKQQPTLSAWEIKRIEEADSELGALSIWVEHTNSVPELIARAKREKVDVLGVDYATLFRMPDVPGSHYLNYDQVAGSTLRFAELAAIMLVVIDSQVHSPEPDLYGLEWGKNLPNRADIVQFLKRDLLTGITMNYVLKNRDGPTGVVPYYVIAPSLRPMELQMLPLGYVTPLGL